MIKRNDLSQAQWRDIDDLLPGKAGDRGRTAVDKRIFVNGVLWVLRSGAHWYHMPERYGVSLTIRTNSAPPREGRASPKARPLAPIDQWLVDNWNEEAHKAGFGAANPSFRAYSKLEALVEKRVSGVRLSFFDEGAVLTGPPKGYKPTQAWYCPDLLSAIWLQFYLAMTGVLPMTVCENPACRTPFPNTRKNKRFCTDTCRSNARHYR